MTAIFLYYFGWPQGQVYSNLIASAICAGLLWWRLHRQGALQHVEALAQAARHHRERLEQHEDLRRHVSAQLSAHCADLKSHVSAVGSHTAMSAVVPQKLPGDIANAPKRQPGGERM